MYDSPEKRKNTWTPPPPHLEVETENGDKKMVQDKGYLRILGINVQSNMNWSSHLETGDKSLLPSIRRQLGALQHLGTKLPSKVRKTLAEGMIISRILYLIPIWGAATGNYVRKAQILLNKTAKWVTGHKRTMKTSKLMQEIGWMNIRELQTQHSLLLMWKCIHLGTPDFMRQRLTVKDDGSLEITEARLKFTGRAFKWKMSSVWNDLPESLRQEKIVAVFKKRLKTWILDQRQEEPD